MEAAGPTFSTWGPKLEAIVGEAPLVICEVAIEYCVLGTALGTAGAGRQVTVVADDWAGATEELFTTGPWIPQTIGPAP